MGGGVQDHWGRLESGLNQVKTCSGYGWSWTRQSEQPQRGVIRPGSKDLERAGDESEPEQFLDRTQTGHQRVRERNPEQFQQMASRLTSQEC